MMESIVQKSLERVLRDTISTMIDWRDLWVPPDHPADISLRK